MTRTTESQSPGFTVYQTITFLGYNNIFSVQLYALVYAVNSLFTDYCSQYQSILPKSAHTWTFDWPTVDTYRQILHDQLDGSTHTL